MFSSSRDLYIPRQLLEEKYFFNIFLVQASNAQFYVDYSARFEDGTANFLGVLSVRHGMFFFKKS